MPAIPSIPVDAYVLTKVVPAILDTSAPKLTELNAAAAVDISCYLVTPGITASGEQAKIPDPRGCARQDYQRLGKVSWTASAQYVENPGSLTVNKAADALLPDTVAFIVERRGIPFDTPLAVGQKVDIYPIQAGLQIPLKEAGQVLRLNQELVLVDEVKQNKAIVA